MGHNAYAEVRGDCRFSHFSSVCYFAISPHSTFSGFSSGPQQWKLICEAYGTKSQARKMLQSNEQSL